MSANVIPERLNETGPGQQFGGLYKLPGWLWNTNSWLTHQKADVEQLHLYTKYEIYDFWYQKFLSQHPSWWKAHQMLHSRMCYMKQQQMMAGYIWWCKKECMVYHRSGYWHKNNWNNDWHSMGIGKASTPPGCAHMENIFRQRQWWTLHTGPQIVLWNHNKLRGTKYVGLILDWQYKTKQVHISMQGFVPKALKWFNHKAGRTCNTNHTPTSHHNMENKSNMHP